MIKLWFGTLLVYASLSALFLFRPDVLHGIPGHVQPYVLTALGPPVMLVWGRESYRAFALATGLFFGSLGIAHFLWSARPHSELFAFPLAAASLVWLFFGWLSWGVSL